MNETRKSQKDLMWGEEKKEDDELTLNMGHPRKDNTSVVIGRISG